jgi:hypothetical protein
MAMPPAICPGPNGLPNRTTPATMPTSGSMLKKAPATSAGTRLCPKANKVNGSTVPPAISPATASATPALPGTPGIRSVQAANGSTASAAPRNCRAVTATGSRPRSSRVCATVNTADTSSDASTTRSPPAVAPPPPPAPVTSPTPASDTANPVQATGWASVRCHTAATTATSTGAAPISRAAWLTLVRSMPMFCSTTDPPYPAAPEASTGQLQEARSWRRATTSKTAAASAKRTKASQPGGSQPSASLDSGTVVPHSSPAVISALMAERRLVFMPP